MSRGERITLLAIAALALLLRAWFDGSTVPGRVFLRHDEQHYVDLARELLNGRFVTDYFINPPLFGWMVAALTALIGGVRVLIGVETGFDLFIARETLSPCAIVLAGRALSIAASVATVLVVARLGTRLFSPRVGRVAALALALDGVAVGRAPLCGNESMTTLLALLSVVEFVRPGLAAAPARSRFLAGLLLGLATACKYSAGIFGLVALVALRRRSLPAIVGAGAGFALFAPATWLNPSAFLDGFTTQAAFLHEGYRDEDAARDLLGWLYYPSRFAGTHQGIAFAVAVALGLFASIGLAVRRSGRDHRLLLAASLPLYLFLGSGIFHRDRFLLPATPYLLLHGAWLLDRLASALPRAGRAGQIAGGLLLLATAADAGHATFERHGQLAAMHRAPDAASELHHQLLPQLRADEVVFEFSLRNADELLLRSDPWAETGVAPPTVAVRSAARQQLAALALLPTCSSLRPALVAAKDLGELQALLARNGATALVAIVPSRNMSRPGALAQANRDPPFRDVAWWPEFAAWLEALPRRAEAITSDGALVGAVLELPR